MAFDGFCLHFTLAELQEQLIDLRVEKIHQPARDEFLILLKGNGRTGRLYLCTNAACARICLTTREIVNPKEPPNFCMLLRKKLRSARLVEIRQAGLDRIAILVFETRNELGDLVRYQLIAELMGRYSNLILTDEKRMILDSAKRVDALMSAKRQILPHMTYELPPTAKKINLLIAAPEMAVDALSKISKPLDKALLATVEGISPAVAREISFFAVQDRACFASMLTEEEKNRLVFYLNHLKETLLDPKKATPCMLLDQDGIPTELSFLPLKQFGALYTVRPYENFSALFEGYYAEKSTTERIRQRAGDLLQWAHSAISRIEKKLGLQEEELAACANREENRICGDLISANLYRMEKGQQELVAENFYDNNASMTIVLDGLLTPAQNAQVYYKRYKKAATAEKTLTEQLTKGREELEYLLSVQEAILRAESEDELAEIRQELIDTGYLKKRSKGPRATATKPLQFRSTDGFVIFVGRNNIQNDRLTLKQSAKNDLWFHVKNIPGSHTVLVTDGKPVPEESRVQAAMLAAFFSKGRHASNVPVDTCLVREVKKPSGAKPGKVIYEHYQTLYVTPTEELTEQLRSK